MEKFTAHWDKLRLFYHIANVKSFSEAAKVLNVSQSALSRSIGILEEHLKIRLFERLSSGLILTRQGEILFESLEKILGELSNAQISLEEEENEPVGPIRISGTAGFTSLYLSTIIPEFLKAYPKIQLSIYGSDILPNLHSDEADVCIAPFIESDDSLIQTHMTTFHLKLYASPAYLKKFGTPLTITDLDQHQLLAYGDHKTLHPFNQANWHLAVGLKKGLRTPYVMINSAIGLFNFASAGMGIASIAREHPTLKSSGLMEILPDLESPTIEAYFIYSARTKKIKRIQLLKSFLLQSFQPEGFLKRSA